MARPTAQPIRDALGFLEPRDVAAAPADFDAVWADDKPSSSLLRGALDRVSDYSFVTTIRDAIADQLVAEDLPATLAAAVIPELLRRPAFAVDKRDGELLHVRHAVIIGRDETLELPFEIVVRVDAWVKRRHVPQGERVAVPGSVVRVEVDLRMVDMEGDAQLGDVMAQYLGWLAEFPAPVTTARDLPNTVVFLGSPTALGCEGAPEEWRQGLIRLAQAFNCAAVFHHGPDFTGSVGANVRQVFRFEPYRGEKPVGPEGEELTAVDIDVRAEPYEAVFQRVAVALANHAEADAPARFALRALEPGERVYHRKVGNNRRYDNFDEGSPTPCAHGEESFQRFGRDKARKGMAHRYSNFEVSWLRHCSKFPNCNLYAVFAPGDRAAGA